MQTLTYLQQSIVRLNMIIILFVINPLPADKILDWSNLKQIAQDIL